MLPTPLASCGRAFPGPNPQKLTILSFKKINLLTLSLIYSTIIHISTFFQSAFGEKITKIVFESEIYFNLCFYPQSSAAFNGICSHARL